MSAKCPRTEPIMMGSDGEALVSKEAVADCMHQHFARVEHAKLHDIHAIVDHYNALPPLTKATRGPAPGVEGLMPPDPLVTPGDVLVS
eukprot:228469-Pyramimonas_sp.AAC.1